MNLTQISFDHSLRFLYSECYYPHLQWVFTAFHARQAAKQQKAYILCATESNTFPCHLWYPFEKGTIWSCYQERCSQSIHYCVGATWLPWLLHVELMRPITRRFPWRVEIVHMAQHPTPGRWSRSQMAPSCLYQGSPTGRSLATSSSQLTY